MVRGLYVDQRIEELQRRMKLLIEANDRMFKYNGMKEMECRNGMKKK